MPHSPGGTLVFSRPDAGHAVCIADEPARGGFRVLQTRRGSSDRTIEAVQMAGRTEPRPRILVAEDDDTLRRLITAVLRDDGYEVIEASDGLALLDGIGEAVARYGGGKRAVSLIVSDIRMPELDGLDVLTALRCSSWGTPVILMTAFSSAETRLEARRLGALVVLNKPFALDELRTLVCRTLTPALPTTLPAPTKITA
jgi:CheY-like chemotaxis protein